MVYHLKPDELVRIAGRRVALSVGRDGRVPPLISARVSPDGRREADPARSIIVPDKPVFLIVEVRADEPLRIGGAVLKWNNIRRRSHGLGPALLIDAPKDTHPVEASDGERYQLTRSDILGVLP